MLGGVCYTEFESHMRKFAWGWGYVVEKVFGVVSKTPESFFKPCVYKMLWCCIYSQFPGNVGMQGTGGISFFVVIF